MMINSMYKLTKISRPDVEGGLRTHSVIGEITSKPEEEHPFQMTADPLNPEAAVRHIETTPVTSVEKDGRVIRFTTKTGSVYELEPS